VNIKLRLFEFRKQLVTGTLTEEKPQLALIVSWLLNFCIGMVLSAVPLGGESGPFGIAVAAQAGFRLGGLFCALGASCGYIIFFGFETGIKYVAAVTLVFAAGYSTQEIKLHRHAFFMPGLAALFTLLTCFLGYYTSETGENVLVSLVLESVLAFGCTYFFREALNSAERLTESAELRHGIALIVLISCILMALSKPMIFGVLSLGRTAAVILILATASKCGARTGCTVGILLGIAMDAAIGQQIYYTAAYGISALIGGFFYQRGRLQFLIGYLITGGLIAILGSNQGIHLEMLCENFAASVVFMILPSKMFGIIGAQFSTSDFSTGESGLRRYTARRLYTMSEAFHDLYATVDHCIGPDRNEEDISKIFDRASEQICSHCKNKTLCWNSNYLDTLSVFNDVSILLKKRGILCESDLPEHFKDQCRYPEKLVSAVNGEMKALIYRQQFRMRLAENRAAAYQQYFDLSEILLGVSNELENSYGPDPLAQRRLRRFLSSLDLDVDLSVFRDKSGRLHILMESVKLKRLLNDPMYLDKLSEVVGVRLCRPIGSDEKTEGRVILLEAEPFSVSVGVASMKKTGESVSGDRGTYFKTEQGILCIILSDGMGSGENAARESVAAVRILERFLRAGVDPALAMKMLNSVMLLRNADTWGFATVDLLCIDLFSGSASFYKYGAAPSYVRSGKQLRRIRSETLAAGLSKADSCQPDIVKLRLHPGNLAVIASDGIIAETDDSWIRKLVCENDGADMKMMARDILQTAVKKYGSTDDMTVLTVRLDKRS